MPDPHPLLAGLDTATWPATCSCGGDGTTVLAELIEEGIVPVAIHLADRTSVELDLAVQRGEVRFGGAEPSQETRVVSLVGDLVLDGVPVRAFVDLSTDALIGTARFSRAAGPS